MAQYSCYFAIILKLSNPFISIFELKQVSL